MPQIDVTAALTNPYTMEKVTVIRREDVVGDDGITRPTETVITPVYGVLAAGFAATMSSTNDLMRRPNADYQNQTKSISFVTKFFLRGATKDPVTGKEYQPDILIYPIGSPDRYVVTRVEDYSRFGRGFVQAEGSAIDMENSPPGTVPGP